jgi:hypothetical protein
MTSFPGKARVNRRRVDGIRRARGEASASRGSREEGAILILAFAYLVAISLVVALLSSWATGALNNSTQFRSANSLTLAATDMTDVAIQYVRYNPLISSSQIPGSSSPFVACWGGQSVKEIPVINGNQIAVWCSTLWNPLTYQTRVVTFVACPISVSEISCQQSIQNPGQQTPTYTDSLLTAVVTYDDYPPAPAKSAPIQTLCSVWCGAGMTVGSWQWGSSTPGTVTGVASSATFSTEPSDTSVSAATNAAVTVLDASNTPVAGDTVTVSELTGPSNAGGPGISPTTAVTNSSGVAEFTDIDPTISGSYTLTAIDGTATANSTSFTVIKQRSVITVTSTDNNATQGKTYAPTFATTPLPGDAVTVSSTPASQSVCTVSNNLVTFVGVGTCTLDFNDPGNATYGPALQVTQTIAVGGLTATQVGMSLSSATPVASGTTNDTITVTLENAVGAQVNSAGTTTVVLSDIGNGDFSTSKLGVTGASTVTVTFPPNTPTENAYFYDTSAGPDTISAVNGTTNWGTVSLNIQSGPATQVAITPSTSSPAVSSSTNTTLAFQLEDQYGNSATSVGTTTLTLSDSGNGYFAASNGATGTSTYSLTFANLVGTATAYFGNETSGSDFITAQNGTTSWGTSTVALTVGAAATVQITLTPTPVRASASTNTTVSLQIEDQFGNHVAANAVTLSLSDSGNGFFATNSGVSPTQFRNPATSTLSVATGSSGSATAYFGDNSDASDTITVTGTVAGTVISATTARFTV